MVVLLGPASAAMHATQSEWGGHLDMLSMYLVAGFAASWAWTRWTRRGIRAFATAYAGCVLACVLIGLWPHPVPVVNYAGNLAFGALLVAAVVLEVRLWRRGETATTFLYGVVALGSMLVAFGIWLLSTNGWCDPESIWQGHAAWHLLCAVAAYWLYRLYASERLLVLARSTFCTPPGRRRRARPGLSGEPACAADPPDLRPADGSGRPRRRAAREPITTTPGSAGGTPCVVDGQRADPRSAGRA